MHIFMNRYTIWCNVSPKTYKMVAERRQSQDRRVHSYRSVAYAVYQINTYLSSAKQGHISSWSCGIGLGVWNVLCDLW